MDKFSIKWIIMNILIDILFSRTLKRFLITMNVLFFTVVCISISFNYLNISESFFIDSGFLKEYLTSSENFSTVCEFFHIHDNETSKLAFLLFIIIPTMLLGTYFLSKIIAIIVGFILNAIILKSM